MKKMRKTKSTTISKALSLAPLSSYALGELKSIIYLCSAIRGNDDYYSNIVKCIHSTNPVLFDITVHGSRDKIRTALQELKKYKIFMTGEAFKAKIMTCCILYNENSFITYELKALEELADCYGERFNWWAKPIDLPKNELHLIVALGGLKTTNIDTNIKKNPRNINSRFRGLHGHHHERLSNDLISVICVDL